MLSFNAKDYVQEPTALLRSLAFRLDEFERENAEAKTGAWTLEVQSALMDIGEKLECGIEHLCKRTSQQAGTGEFLLDAVWWRRVAPGLAEHVALAVESEFAGWAKNRGDVANEVLRDFEKLLVVKSPLKLMIFCSWYAKGDTDLVAMRQSIWSRLKECLAQYTHHIEGEKYLFLDTAVIGERKAWVFTVPRSGRISIEDITEEQVSL